MDTTMALTSRTSAASDGCGTLTVQPPVASILGHTSMEQRLLACNERRCPGKEVCFKAFAHLLGIGVVRLRGSLHGKIDMRRNIPGTACISVSQLFV